MYKDAVCAETMQSVGWRYLGAECLCAVTTNWHYSNGCYKFKMLIVISKVTTKKQLKNYTKKEEENQNSTLQKNKKTNRQ